MGDLTAGALVAVTSVLNESWSPLRCAPGPFCACTRDYHLGRLPLGVQSPYTMGGAYTEMVILQTIRPKRCLAKGAAVLLLLGLCCPVAADEPTLARLSFWVPPERMSAFEAV